MSIIKFDQVTFTYDGDDDGVYDLVFSIEDGELCFITGRSGSGKSTLSKLLTGEITPSHGSVRVNGYKMGTISRKNIARARRTIGMVFQDFRLIREMTVYENLEFAMRCIGRTGAEAHQRIDEMLNLVELSGKSHRYPRELSGGEQQRVAIARAMINEPSILIADEPTGNLDPSLANSIMELFLKINELGTTVLIITHAKDLVDKTGARVITMDNGHIISDTAGTRKQPRRQFLSDIE